jgi:hypothetical protein
MNCHFLGRRLWLLIGIGLAIGCGRSPKDKPPENVQPTALASASLGQLTSTPAQRLKQLDDQTFDPESDGWETEDFVEQAQQQLKQATAMLAEPVSISAAALEPLVTESFSCAPLLPSQWTQVVELKNVRVRRGKVDAVAPADVCGADRLAAALAELAASLGDASAVHVHIKFYGITMLPDSVTTTIDFEASGRLIDGSIQQNATWVGTWTRPDNGVPLLTSLHVTMFEEIVTRSPAGTWFADCTTAVLGGNASFGEQIVYGQNHWLSRIERVHQMQIYERSGLAVGDVNGDGWDDLYICQCAGLPNRLYVQQADGTAMDVSHQAGVDWLDDTNAALLVDLDNDGDADLALSGVMGVLLMENDGSGRFQLKQRLDIDRSAESLSAVDYDNDGDLDLYGCVYRADRRADDANGQAAPEFLYHDANNGGANRLFRNELVPQDKGQWTFTDVTVASGLDEANRRWSLAASWEDFDNDGDQDLYVANDYGQNCLYRNDQGQFTNVASAMGVVDYGSGMSVSWGDYDRDGWMDLYVGNMFSSAGNRITTQPQFMARSDPATRALYQRFAKGNSLFRNLAGKGFQEVGRDAAVEIARWAWSSLFVDVNNDGWQDLLVTNGFMTGPDSRDL